MSCSNQLLNRLDATFSKINQMECDLNSIEHRKQNNDRNKIGLWQTLIKDKLFDIKSGIKSLDEYSKKLKQQQLSLKDEIKTLNHQITQLQNNVTKKCKCNKKTPKRSVYHQNQIPDSILNNKQLAEAIKRGLPSNYNFEIHKTIWRLSQCEPKCKRVALQFPEGLQMYSCIISDILQQFVDGIECIILGDVTYGACCIDDYTSLALQCDFLIHYGHSCLIPINNLNDKYYQRILYVFVEININQTHLIKTIKLNFRPNKNKKIVIAGTIQFVSILQNVKKELCLNHGYADENIIIPQAKPLSPAEVLGCTSVDLCKNYGSDIDCVIFIADGRFHLESLMICNPAIDKKDGFFRYNPYDNKITKEVYNRNLMHKIRYNAIGIAKRKYDAKWCIILSTLGRQGNGNILNRLCKMMNDKNIEYVIVLLSEIYGEKLKRFDLNEIQCFIQIGCPRLSIDWGDNILSDTNIEDIPLLNAYEATVALEEIEWKSVYPMDYYRNDGGIWSNYYMTEKEKKEKETQRKERRKELRRQRLIKKNNKNKIVVQYQ